MACFDTILAGHLVVVVQSRNAISGCEVITIKETRPKTFFNVAHCSASTTQPGSFVQIMEITMSPTE